jgi:hypothetical protein
VCAAFTGTLPRGPDLIYSYTPAVSGPFLVTLIPEATFDPLLWVTEGVCGGTGAACVAYSETYGGGVVESAKVNGVAGTPYFFLVDAASNTSASRLGNFTIRVD